MTAVSRANCDRVLAYIMEAVERNGTPPTFSMTACDLGLCRTSVSQATAVLVWEERLPAHLRSAAAFAEHRNARLRALSGEGASKTSIARQAGLSVRTIHRIIPLTQAG